MKRLFFILMIILASTGVSITQTPCCPYIDSIVVIPASPTDQDVIQIVTRSTTPALGHQIYYMHHQVNDTIFLDGCFYSGMLTAIQTYLDTTVIGPLPAGTYHIHYIGKITGDISRCEVVQFQTMAASFVVTSTTVGTADASLQSGSITVYPNPTSGIVNILFEPVVHENLHWKIYDIEGRCLAEGSHSGEIAEAFADFSFLSPGVYLLRITSSANTETIRIIRE